MEKHVFRDRILSNYLWHTTFMLFGQCQQNWIETFSLWFCHCCVCVFSCTIQISSLKCRTELRSKYRRKHTCTRTLTEDIWIFCCDNKRNFSVFLGCLICNSVDYWIGRRNRMKHMRRTHKHTHTYKLIVDSLSETMTIATVERRVERHRSVNSQNFTETHVFFYCKRCLIANVQLHEQ